MLHSIYPLKCLDLFFTSFITLSFSGLNALIQRIVTGFCFVFKKKNVSYNSHTTQLPFSSIQVSGFSIFTNLCDHHHFYFQNISITPKRNLTPIIPLATHHLSPQQLLISFLSLDFYFLDISSSCSSLSILQHVSVLLNFL